jgi:hypothetical protein
MPRPRKFESDAHKQRVYRLRRKMESTDAEKLHYARLEALHRTVRRAASDGDEAAKKLLGRNASDTALKIILTTQPAPDDDSDEHQATDLFGFSMAYYAYEEAASSVLLRRSESKDGVFQVVIGTEKRVPRKAQSIADRPKRPGKSRARNVTDSGRAAPKSRKKTAL